MLRAACEVVIPSCAEIKTEHYILTYMLGVTRSSGMNVNIPDSFESGMLLIWHISGFMNVIVGSQLPSDIFIREMKGVVP